MGGLPARKAALRFFRVYACAPTLVTQCGGPHKMAKALYGHVGGPDPRMVSEMRRLQQRVRDLEAELARLHEENDVLAAEVGQDLVVRARSARADRTAVGWPARAGGPSEAQAPLFACPPYAAVRSAPPSRGPPMCRARNRSPAGALLDQNAWSWQPASMPPAGGLLV